MTVGLAAAACTLLLIGCASPGLPRAPSLQLPAVVTDLQATRHGDEVELGFAVPSETTEGLRYRGATVRARVCRAVDAESCVPVAALVGVSLNVPGAGAAASGATGNAGGPGAGGSGAAGQQATLHDVLPASLTGGPARLLTYRVELSNAAGRSAGFGDAAYSAGGPSPAGVAGLRAEGSRGGVVVRWQGDAGVGRAGSEVVLRREQVGGLAPGTERVLPKAGEGIPPKAGSKTARAPVAKRAAKREGKRTGGEGPGVMWLHTDPTPDPLQQGQAHEQGGAHEAVSAPPANGVLDDGAVVDGTYRYAAERQQTVQLGGHTVTVESVLSAPVEVTLRAVYPPPAPTDLAGTSFPVGTAGNEAGAGGVAVDLIWTPADDAKTVGYYVYRERLGSGATGAGSRSRLTVQPVRMPAFHDVLPPELAGATATVRLRYSVTAVDGSGMESAPVTVVVESGR